MVALAYRLAGINAAIDVGGIPSQIGGRASQASPVNGIARSARRHDAQNREQIG
jgi:hypothetical protein